VDTDRWDRGHVVRRVFFALPVLAVMPAFPAEAEMFEPGFRPCGDKIHTLAPRQHWNPREYWVRALTLAVACT
jgi:hypothetical protein